MMSARRPTLHVELNHDSCLEATVLKNRSTEVKAFADRVIVEHDVRHGHVVFMPVEADGTGIQADIACEERPAPRLANSASLSVDRHKS